MKNKLLLLALIISVFGISYYVLALNNNTETQTDIMELTSKTVRPEQENPQADMPKIEELPMNEYTDISPDEAQDLINSMPDLIIIDVSPNYDQGHIPGAINYYVGDGTLDAAIPNLDPTATYLVYCHTDAASKLGAQKLIDAGFSKVYRLEGNYSAWVDAGYTVE